MIRNWNGRLTEDMPATYIWRREDMRWKVWHWYMKTGSRLWRVCMPKLKTSMWKYLISRRWNIWNCWGTINWERYAWEDKGIVEDSVENVSAVAGFHSPVYGHSNHRMCHSGRHRNNHGHNRSMCGSGIRGDVLLVDIHRKDMEGSGSGQDGISAVVRDGVERMDRSSSQNWRKILINIMKVCYFYRWTSDDGRHIMLFVLIFWHQKFDGRVSQWRNVVMIFLHFFHFLRKKQVSLEYICRKKQKHLLCL